VTQILFTPIKNRHFVIIWLMCCHLEFYFAFVRNAFTIKLYQWIQ